MEINDILKLDIVKQLNLRRYLREIIKAEAKRKPQVGLLIDGPNIMRKEFQVDLADVRKKAGKYGEIKIAKAFLNQYAKDKLIEAVANQGFEPAMSISEDVDVELAVEAMDLIFSNKIDTLVLVTRDGDFLPLIRRAKEKNKKVILLGAQPGLSLALKNAADKTEILSKRKLF